MLLKRGGLGAEFASEVNRAIESAAQNPTRFPIMHRDVRCIRARRFPYSVFFRVEAARLVVSIMRVKRSDFGDVSSLVNGFLPNRA